MTSLPTTSRTVTLDAPLVDVWRSLTDADALADWLGLRIEGPLEAQSLGVQEEDGIQRRVRVLEVQTGSSLTWEWADEHDSTSVSIVSIQVDGVGDSTVVTVTETRGAAASCSLAAAGAAAWDQRLLGLELRFIGTRSHATV